MILIVFLILVEREVLINILHIGHCLVRRVVALVAGIGVGRVALRIVHIFISAEDISAHVIVVGAAEIVIVVGGRVVHDTIECGSTHLALYRLEELLIRLEVALFLIVQTVITQVLQCTCTFAGGKRVCLSGLSGNLTPLSECVAICSINR